MDLREIEWGDMAWIGLVQDRYKWIALLNAVTNLLAPVTG
jgi:hypothetical protein